MQGHFQIMFNPKVCPLFQSQLSWGMRILYSSGVWAYMCAAISTPTFIIIPLVGPIHHPATDVMCTLSPLLSACDHMYRSVLGELSAKLALCVMHTC